MNNIQLIEECIQWNLKKADKTDDPKDKARYQENVRKLLEMIDDVSS